MSDSVDLLEILLSEHYIMWGIIIVILIILFLIYMGYNSTPVVCPEGKSSEGGLCYDKPRSGYSCTALTCTKDCPPGMRNDGLFCAKQSTSRTGGTIPNKCAAGQEGPPCYEKCKDGYEGVGPVCWEKCPPGQTNTGVACLVEADSKLIDKYKRADFGRFPDKSPCPPGMRDDGTSCWDDLKTTDQGRYKYIWGCLGCHDGSNVCKDDCYKVWEPKLVTTGCGCIKKTLFERQTCKADEDMHIGMCYPKCRSGYGSSDLDVLFCKSKAGCPQGYIDTGLTCYRGPISTTKKSFIRPLKNALCDNNLEKDAGGLCYSKCPSNTTGVGPLCWSGCPTGYGEMGVSCAKPSYARPVGIIPNDCPSGKVKMLGRCVGIPFKS